MNLVENLLQTLPLSFLVLTGLFLMLLDAFKARSVMPLIAGIGLLGSMILALFDLNDRTTTAFSGMLYVNGIASLIHAFLCVSGLFTLFFVGDYLKRQDKPIYDLYTLIIFAVTGMVMLANAHDLIITFIGLETMSVCLYIMAASFKKDVKSNEAGLKYFLLGAFATGFFIYGIALIYGITGSTNFGEFEGMYVGSITENPMFYPAIGLILIGFLFKVSGFPFHMWTPDVYEGTPTPLAGFMATGSKMAAFIALGSFLNQVVDVSNDEKLTTILGGCALLTMIYGNFVAIRQKNIKRMLAYSSIAHSGYVLLALCAGPDGFSAAIFYMLIYTLMNIGAFGMISMAEVRYEDTNIDSWKGLGMKNPWFGAALSVFLFSLAGIPPLAGFMAKYLVFISVIKADLVLLAVLGILSSVAGAFYYIRIIVIMYFGKNEEPATLSTKAWVPAVGVGLLVVLVLLLGVYPSAVWEHLDLVFGKAGFYALR